MRDIIFIMAIGGAVRCGAVGGLITGEPRCVLINGLTACTCTERTCPAVLVSAGNDNQKHVSVRHLGVLYFYVGYGCSPVTYSTIGLIYRQNWPDRDICIFYLSVDCLV